MSILTKAVLAWLLMLAIPLQGFASTAMLFCEPGHHGAAASATISQAAHTHSSGSAGYESHQHGDDDVGQPAGGTLGSLSVDKAAHHHSSVTKVGKATDGKCSACAACCTGTAIVGTQAASSSAVAGSVLVPFVVAVFVSYIPLGFDPPPRAFLA